MRKKAFCTTILACLLTATFAFSAVADDFVFFAPIVGSNPGVSLGGVNSGGAPWVVRRGTAIVTEGGRVRAEVRGLILPNAGNAGPVTQVSASVVCSNAVVGTTKAFNLSNNGNADIRGKVTLPSPCLGAIVLIRVAGTNNSPLSAPGPFIAASGLAKPSPDNNDDDEDNNQDNHDDNHNNNHGH